MKDKREQKLQSMFDDIGSIEANIVQSPELTLIYENSKSLQLAFDKLEEARELIKKVF